MNLSVAFNIPLAPLTTLKVGGNASHYVALTDEEILKDVVQYAEEHSLSVVTLSGGSNVLISEEGIRGLLLHIKTKGVTVREEGEAVYLTAKAGEVLDEVVLRAVREGWWGIENLSAIPGSVGATPVQNVGAYGVEVKDVIHSVKVFNTFTKQYELLTREECALGYRDSLFKHTEGKKYIITEVTFLLSKTPIPKLSYKDLSERFADVPNPSLQEIREAVISTRSQKFPDWRTVGTAGSFFKNPIITKEQYEVIRAKCGEVPGFPHGEKIKISLGFVLDKLMGLRGYCEGNVCLYEKQALVLVARSGATANEVYTFAKNVTQQVEEKIGVPIEMEVTPLL